MKHSTGLKMSLLGAALLLFGGTALPGGNGLFAAERETHTVIGIFGTTST